MIVKPLAFEGVFFDVDLPLHFSESAVAQKILKTRCALNMTIDSRFFSGEKFARGLGGWDLSYDHSAILDNAFIEKQTIQLSEVLYRAIKLYGRLEVNALSKENTPNLRNLPPGPPPVQFVLNQGTTIPVKFQTPVTTHMKARFEDVSFTYIDKKVIVYYLPVEDNRLRLGGSAKNEIDEIIFRRILSIEEINSAQNIQVESGALFLRPTKSEPTSQP